MKRQAIVRLSSGGSIIVPPDGRVLVGHGVVVVYGLPEKMLAVPLEDVAEIVFEAIATPDRILME